MIQMYGGDESDYMPDINLNPAIIEAYNLFADLETQWRQAPNGALTGFDYASIAFVMDIHGIKDKKQAFSDVRIMEAAARTIINQEVSTT